MEDSLTRTQRRAIPLILAEKSIETGCRSAGIAKQTFDREGGYARKREKLLLFVTLRRLEDPSKWHNSLEPCGKNHGTPTGGLMALKGRFRGKSSMKETGTAQFRHGFVEFLSFFDRERTACPVP